MPHPSTAATTPTGHTSPTLLAAPFHPDPYPFYAALRAAHPSGLHHDPDAKLWVASSAAAVEDVFCHAALRVRPTAEPVPEAIAGRPAGQLFGDLMRQNDGPVHTQGKAWASRLLAQALPVADAARTVVAAGGSPQRRPINALLFEAPLLVLWHLLCPDEGEPGQMPLDVRAVLAAWAAGADETTRTAGHEAATRLLARLGGEPNRVGLFTQTCEATGGLIGAMLVALQREPGLRERWLADPSLDEALAMEVARHDPPTHNTRRFVAEPCTVRGHALQPGEAILLMLASANRDTTHTADADRFVLNRQGAINFVWGLGAHGCPGAALSRQIATALLRAWHEDGSPIAQLTTRWHHRPSPNGRLAQFGVPE